MNPNDIQGWHQTKKMFLDPITIRPSEAFINKTMRLVRTWEAPEPWISRLLRPVFTRFAFPALSLSMAGFTVALLYAVQPVNKSGDALVLGGHASSVTTEWKDSLADDQIMGLLVSKP